MNPFSNFGISQYHQRHIQAWSIINLGYTVETEQDILKVMDESLIRAKQGDDEADFIYSLFNIRTRIFKP